MITPRLQEIINLIKSDSIADIGTDHAYIPIDLARKGRIKKAIATDLNKGPIEIAASNVKRYQLDGIIELRIGSGLEPVKVGETKEIIIAGMGGRLICDIIENSIEKASASDLILQPMNAQCELRKKLFELGFSVEKEALGAEGFKVYNVMRVIKKSSVAPDKEIYYHLPRELFSHKFFKMLLEKKEREFNKIINGQKNSANPDINILNYYTGLKSELDIIKSEIKGKE